MTALYRDPHALAGILRERQESYEFVARGTVGYYEKTLDFGAWVAEKRSQCAHGVWMRTLRELGWSYSTCNRAIKLHRLGISAAELARDGAKAVLKRFARPRRPAGAGEADPDPAEFSAGAKFEPPPGASELAEAAAPPDEFEEPVPEGENAGEGDAGAIEEAWQTVRERLRSEFADGEFKDWIEQCRIERREARAAVIAPARLLSDRVRQEYGDRIRDMWRQELPDVELDYDVAPERGIAQGRLVTEPEPDDDSDGTPLWPWPLDMKYSGDRMIRCLIAPEIKLPQARLPIAILAYWNFFDRDGKQRTASIHNARLAKLFGVDVRTLQDWLDDCRRAGWLHSVKQRGNQPDRQYVWPNTPPGMRQRSMPLPRTFDRAHRASALEAAESAAARPGDEAGFTPGMNPASSRDEAGFAPGVTQDSSLNGDQTERETGIGTHTLGEAVEVWNLMAVRAGLATCIDLKGERRDALARCLDDAGGIEGWREACDRIVGSSFLTGGGRRGFRADIDFITQPNQFRKLREGAYDDTEKDTELRRTLNAIKWA